MNSNSTSSLRTTIYVGNILSISEDEIRTYFERFARVEAIYHQALSNDDLWLIDYRFIRFSSDTDITRFFNNQIDHQIGRIYLEIHPYDVACRPETRLVSDRKICISHQNSRLQRNMLMKSFKKYGKILNCHHVSSSSGSEHVYIEYESINPLQSIFAHRKPHLVNQTLLTVRKALRPVPTSIKREPIVHHFPSLNAPPHSSFVKHRQSSPSNNRTIDVETNQCSSCSEQQLEDFEQEYDLIIRKDFDEMTHQIDKLLRDQETSYRELRRLIRKTAHSYVTSSSSSDDDNCRSTEQKRRKSDY